LPTLFRKHDAYLRQIHREKLKNVAVLIQNRSYAKENHTRIGKEGFYERDKIKVGTSFHLSGLN
jgi:hypothetical protein